MIQGQRMALEGGVPIGLGEMPGIPRLGGEAEVGKPQIFGHGGLLQEQGKVGPRPEMRLDENRRQEQHAAPDKEPKAIGLAHGLTPIGSQCWTWSNHGGVRGSPPAQVLFVKGFYQCRGDFLK